MGCKEVYDPFKELQKLAPSCWGEAELGGAVRKEVKNLKFTWT